LNTRRFAELNLYVNLDMNRKITQLYFAITLVAFLSAVSVAQNKESAVRKPDLTGTWLIEKPTVSAKKNHVLVITQTGDEIVLHESLEYNGKPVSNRTILYADRRGERNPLLALNAEVETEVQSHTQWKKDKLIRECMFNSSFMIGPNSYSELTKQTERYSLSKDGNLLTVETTFQSESPFAGGRPKFGSGKRIHRRKS
jgi:hypothetical protein